MHAEELVRAGQLGEALQKLQEQVRDKPADAKLRIFLFQLLCVLGDWDRALTQLNVVSDMDDKTMLMAHVCRPALQCEALRGEIFQGKRLPHLFGEPEEWVGWVVQANQMTGQGQIAASQELRDRAFEAAPAVSGQIDDEQFEWIADADPRLGPVVEAVIDGQYYWVPFTNIREVRFEEPVDLRDVVWTPANFIWTNGGTSVGLIPTRYPRSEQVEDNDIRLGRKTEWEETEAGLYLGLGQRLFATDQGEYPIQAVRRIVLGAAEDTSSGEPADG